MKTTHSQYIKELERYQDDMNYYLSDSLDDIATLANSGSTDGQYYKNGLTPALAKLAHINFIVQAMGKCIQNIKSKQ
jgi:hypothetical protein